MAVLPLPLAMIVCDHVWRDPGTDKMTILGAFSAIDVSEFPAVLPEMAVYLALTDAHGKVPIKIQIIDSPEALPAPIASAELRLDFVDPIATIEAAVVLDNVRFPSAGEYRLQMFAKGELLIERRIVIGYPE
jgi:hypothetical protein